MNHRRIVSCSLVGLAIALLLVGLVSGTVLRHVVQILPLVATAGLIARRADWGAYAALPIFVCWIVIVALIWLFLFGLSPVASGHYTVIEIVLTFFMAGFSVAGIVNALVLGKGLPPISKVAMVVLFGLLQVGAVWISFLRPIANR